MLLDINVKTQEEVISFLERVGFEYIMDDSNLRSPYYQYVDIDYTIKVILDVAGIGNKVLIHIGLFGIDMATKTIPNSYTGDDSIHFLNNKFKHKLRKEKLKKLLSQNT